MYVESQANGLIQCFLLMAVSRPKGAGLLVPTEGGANGDEITISGEVLVLGGIGRVDTARETKMGDDG